VIDSCRGLGLGHGSRVMRVTGQLNDGSRGSRVTKCDPLSALLWGAKFSTRLSSRSNGQIFSHGYTRSYRATSLPLPVI